jgi:hypothetical protein
MVVKGRECCRSRVVTRAAGIVAAMIAAKVLAGMVI